MAWYNTYRPQTFDQVVGQELVKKILQRALETGNIRHAYLITGPRGVGKTTLARIFARAINGDESAHEVDIIELDAASNTGIDDIRLLRESASVPPISGKYKVFIIDEVHMLSKSAMNALLKILEEPPQYVVFLLATTNPEKILTTVTSRLTKLPLSEHSVNNIVQNLRRIADIEGVSIADESLQLIAERSGGAQRDAINTLETLAGYGFETLDTSTVAALLGVVPSDIIQNLYTTLYDTSGVIEYITTIESLGIEPSQFLDQALGYYLDQSLVEKEIYSPLIQALAQVASMKLPLVTIAQTIALVRSYLVISSDQAQKKISPVKNKPEKISPLESSPTVGTIPTDTNKDTEEKEIPLQKEKIVLNSDEVQKILLREDKPQALKLIPDLSLTVKEGVVLVSTSIGMFVPSLKSKSVQQWMQSSIQEITGKEVSIEVVQNQAVAPTKKSSLDHKVSEDAPIHPQQTTTDTAPKKPLKGDDFYSVYGVLPNEGNTKGLKIFQGELADPVKNPDAQEKSFDDHVDELFEFE